MVDYSKLDKGELIARLETLEAALRRDQESAGESEAGRLLHELQVHQIELEMQNRELREAQADIEAARDRYADLYDFAPVGYASFDEKGVIRELNLSLASMLGVERSCLIGRPFAHYLDESNAFFSYLRRCRQCGGEKQTAEFTVKSRGWDRMAVEMVALAPPAAAGEVVIRASIMDITARKKLEEEQRQRFLEVERTNHLMVGREIQIGELQEEIGELKREIDLLRGQGGGDSS